MLKLRQLDIVKLTANWLSACGLGRGISMYKSGRSTNYLIGYQGVRACSLGHARNDNTVIAHCLRSIHSIGTAFIPLIKRGENEWQWLLKSDLIIIPFLFLMLPSIRMDWLFPWHIFPYVKWCAGIINKNRAASFQNSYCLSLSWACLSQPVWCQPVGRVGLSLNDSVSMKHCIFNYS